MVENEDTQSNAKPPRSCDRKSLPDVKTGEKSDEKSAIKRDIIRKMSVLSLKNKKVIKKYKGYTKLFLSGVSLMGLAYIIHLVNPIQLIKDNMLNMTDGSFIFNIWKVPPLSLNFNIYMFNITNADKFLRGIDAKLKVEEIGPYTYSESIVHKDIKWNDNNTISYTPERKVKFVRELSIGDPTKDIVTVANVPLLGIATMLHDSSLAVNIALSSMVRYHNSQPILKMSVDDFLWGYDDPIVHVVNSLLPNWIDFSKFGMLDRLLNEGENRVTMFLNATDDNPMYSINKFNGSPGLKSWGYDLKTNNSSKCSKVEGNLEGILFPRNINTVTSFNIYRPAFCRSFPLVFNKEIKTNNGLPAYLYKFPDDILDPNNPENNCYCSKKKTCLPNGLTDLSPCYYEIPVAVSLPHFINGNRSLIEAVDGMKPNKTRHETTFAVQPEVGVPLFLNIKIQTNLAVRRTKFLPNLKPFHDLVIPIFWMEIQLVSLPKYLTFLLDLLLVIGPVLQLGSIILLFTIGLALVFTANLRYAWQHGLLDRRKTATIITYKQKQRQQEIIVRKNSQYLQLLPNVSAQINTIKNR